MSEEYKRWRNPKGLGQTAFVTTTCLDFAHLFHRQEMRTRCALHLLEACDHNEARLHAFVVMSHHVHYLVTPNERQSISDFSKSFKSYCAKQLLPLLNAEERLQLAEQTGLNRRSFWKVGFRGWAIYSEEMYFQKVNYINENPVRAGMTKPGDVYGWSSDALNQLGHHDGFGGILLPDGIAYFKSMLK